MTLPLLFAVAALQGVSPPNAPPPLELRITRVPEPTRYYPAKERKAGRGGTSALDLGVRYDGAVTRCTVSRSSGSAPLDKAACKLTQELRFEAIPLAERFPAVEYGCCMEVHVAWADGTAQVRRISIPVSARITNRAEVLTDLGYPPAALREAAAGAVTAELAVDAAGRITGCSIAESSGSASLDAETCRLAQSRAKVAPATDRFAEPVAGSARFRIVWRLSP